MGTIAIACPLGYGWSLDLPQSKIGISLILKVEGGLNPPLMRFRNLYMSEYNQEKIKFVLGVIFIFLIYSLAFWFGVKMVSADVSDINEGFEEYTTGSISGQGNWGTSNIPETNLFTIAEVTDSFSNYGSQSLNFIGSQYEAKYDYGSTTTFDYFIAYVYANASTTANIYPSESDANPGNRLFQVAIYGGATSTMVCAGGQDNPSPLICKYNIPLNTWIKIEVIADGTKFDFYANDDKFLDDETPYANDFQYLHLYGNYFYLDSIGLNGETAGSTGNSPTIEWYYPQDNYIMNNTQLNDYIFDINIPEAYIGDLTGIFIRFDKEDGTSGFDEYDTYTPVVGETRFTVDRKYAFDSNGWWLGNAQLASLYGDCDSLETEWDGCEFGHLAYSGTVRFYVDINATSTLFNPLGYFEWQASTTEEEEGWSGYIETRLNKFLNIFPLSVFADVLYLRNKILEDWNTSPLEVTFNDLIPAEYTGITSTSTLLSADLINDNLSLWEDKIYPAIEDLVYFFWFVWFIFFIKGQFSTNDN